MILLAQLAMAAPDVGTATIVVGSVGRPVTEEGSALGVGQDVSLGVAPWLRVEAGAAVGSAFSGTFRGEAWVGPRFVLAGDSPEQPSMAFTAAVGGAYTAAMSPHLWVGAGGSVPIRSAPSLRFDLGYRFDDLEGGGATFLRVGLVWPPKAQESPAPASPAAPPEGRPPPRVDTDPTTALVWIPHPVCAWVPAAEAAALLAASPAGGLLEVTAPGRIPVAVPNDGDVVVRLPDAPAQGNVLVVAMPGDRVRVGGVQVPPSEGGIAVAAVPEGAVSAEVTGGGRAAQLEGAVTSGYALWLRAPTPTPTLLSFQPGSSALSRADRLVIQTLAERRGDWRFVVVGEASSDGHLEANLALASARAAETIRALEAAGVPPTAIENGAPQLSEEGGRRAVQITPQPPGSP